MGTGINPASPASPHTPAPLPPPLNHTYTSVHLYVVGRMKNIDHVYQLKFMGNHFRKADRYIGSTIDQLL